MSASPLIEVKELGFSYDNNLVLEDVSFTVQKGDYVGLVGPNGGGKTTLLKLLVGLLEPTAGSVLIDRSRIGYVPQRIAQDQLSFPATVQEVVESGRTPKKGWWNVLNRADHVMIEKALHVAGIAQLKGRLMSSLSGGQRQRVYVARALAGEPSILLLDEPFVGVDVTTQQSFYAFLKELNTRHGLTIVFVSHDIDAIAEEAKSILCLNRGLLCSGSPSLLHQPHIIDDVYGKKITHIHRHA